MKKRILFFAVMAFAMSFMFATAAHASAPNPANPGNPGRITATFGGNPTLPPAGVPTLLPGDNYPAPPNDLLSRIAYAEARLAETMFLLTAYRKRMQKPNLAMENLVFSNQP